MSTERVRLIPIYTLLRATGPHGVTNMALTVRPQYIISAEPDYEIIITNQRERPFKAGPWTYVVAKCWPCSDGIFKSPGFSIYCHSLVILRDCLWRLIKTEDKETALFMSLLDEVIANDEL